MISEDGRLLADVRGGDRYVVSVWQAAEALDDSPLESRCTCPVDYVGCKHAVAVVAEFLQRVADGAPVPAGDPQDPRWARLDDESGDEFDEDEDFETWDEPQSQRTRASTSSRSPGGRSRADWDR